ncbi:hypothetical protein [Thiolapillus sp.]|uniref:hypothetical protein n=1 Tax=Thiolapillus sp. TaxID=2017437 RepID=UPI003AF4F7CF
MTEPSCKLLSQTFPNCELTVVSDAVAFAEQLANGGFSAVISEQVLGGHPEWKYLPRSPGVTR